MTFVLCNTDAQALNDSPVPVHLQLGKEGLGAGNRPERARQAAEDTIEDIKHMLDDGTKDGIYHCWYGWWNRNRSCSCDSTRQQRIRYSNRWYRHDSIPLRGAKKIDQALDGVEEMAKHVDALLVINNERLREIYPELSLIDAFRKADDTLSVAAKSIAEIITVHGIMNLDFNDVKTVLKDGGVALCLQVMEKVKDASNRLLKTHLTHHCLMTMMSISQRRSCFLLTSTVITRRMQV